MSVVPNIRVSSLPQQHLAGQILRKQVGQEYYRQDCKCELQAENDSYKAMNVFSSSFLAFIASHTACSAQDVFFTIQLRNNNQCLDERSVPPCLSDWLDISESSNLTTKGYMAGPHLSDVFTWKIKPNSKFKSVTSVLFHTY